MYKLYYMSKLIIMIVIIIVAGSQNCMHYQCVAIYDELR